ncbi:DUF6913 domain-containing protein [Mesohalobacter halotolerans]|uniref:Uncharacterized protein n=1 Tax=Mesohalobacter halotolerans TaxID=1883405 RepID=A0A4U5TS64_9FLAO|nr:hypothetical protein [Mesohalobacter halotolerans]TKS56168.1 hypothetical protein FCN74_09140 [Mesohalobacter halotolerans]
MINLVKSFYIRRNTSVNQKATGLKYYPQSFSKVGIFCLASNIPDDNLITKIKYTLGDQVQLIIFVLEKNHKLDKAYSLSKSTFDVFGKIKNPSLHKDLSGLDMLIDLSQKVSFIKDYAISIANQAYKISLGQYENNIYHLSIKLDRYESSLFGDEILKYHKILGNGRS